MIVLNIKEILKILNCNKEADFPINKIETNSKNIEKGDLFIAINKGHDYIDEAILNGAVAVIVNNKKCYDCLTINVDNTIVALGKIASYIRDLYDIPLIAVTGSCGKTTTKELISLILSKKYNVLKNEKNYNNEIGLPLTLLNLNNNHDIIVLEMGMNNRGEISYLSKLSKPNYGVITNIGTAHIGNLKGIRNIFKAKLEILDGMKDGKLIVNKNDKRLKRLSSKKTIKVDDKTLKVKNITFYFDKTEFDIESTHFIFNIPGKSVLNDLFIAIKIGIMFNISLEDIQEVVLNFKNLEGRLNIIKKNYTIIDDSYNSNYESLVNSLSLLKDNNKYKIIVIGDMLELGKYSKKYHKKVNKILNKIDNKEVLLIGNYTKYIKGKHFNNLDEIIKYLKNKLDNDMILYLKGSRAINLDKIKTRFN